MEHLLYLVSSETRINNKFVLHSFLNVFTAWLRIGGDGVRRSHWSRASLQLTLTLAELLSKANVKLTCYWILSITTGKINWDAFRMFSFPASLSWTNLSPYLLLFACLSYLVNCEAQTLGLPPLIHPTAPPLWADHVVGAGLDESPLTPSRFFTCKPVILYWGFIFYINHLPHLKIHFFWLPCKNKIILHYSGRMEVMTVLLCAVISLSFIFVQYGFPLSGAFHSCV